MANVAGSSMAPQTASNRPMTLLEPPKDVLREIMETLVFVVVLVLMLKLFVAEAFVIPTGSMAETLFGDQINLECLSCKHSVQLNSSPNPNTGIRDSRNYSSYICPNCGFQGPHKDLHQWSTGDRVLVGKYDYHLRQPRRFEVPVFKFPERPYDSRDMITVNYIKRLIGLPGETIAVYAGDLYVNTDLNYAEKLRPRDPMELWRSEYTYRNEFAAIDLFRKGKFKMIRKSPAEILAVRRPVFNLDEQPKDLSGPKKTRWHPAQNEGTGWDMLAAGFEHRGAEWGWMRYQHIQPGWKSPDDAMAPTYIDDFLGYNLGDTESWVPDLILEAQVEFREADSSVIFELAKATDRLQAEFRSGKCTLRRIRTESGVEQPPVEMASVETKLTTPGTYSLRFANVDSRLTVWIDGKPLVFGNKPDSDELLCDYDPPDKNNFMPTDNDIYRPARIGSSGNVVCKSVRLSRDIYYLSVGNYVKRRDDWTVKNLRQNGNLHDANMAERRRSETDRGNEPTLETYYVQPGHYLCLGDNSASSADSRDWGLVPERLLLGRAVAVYWPYYRWRVIE